MPVVVIDTIKPKNNGTFPVVEAVDVKVTDSKRLDAALNEKASQADVTALQTAVAGKASQADLTALSETVSGKQNALTEEQLTAANSGITSALVTQIGTNTTAIEGKASAADLATTNAAVAGKADASDVDTSVANLQSQIDNIVSGSTADSEVINARVDVDGTTYSTLKGRLDADYTQTSGEIENINAEFVHINEFDKTAAEIVSIMCNPSLVFISGGGVQSTIWKCKPNTKYTVSWNRISGNSRFFVYLSTNLPVVDSTSAANSAVELTETISGSTRQYKTFTTGANDNYMLLYFWVNATGGDDTLNDIQISEGETLYPYTSHDIYRMPNLSVLSSNLPANFTVQECEDARVNVEGTTYASLEARLNADYNKNQSDIGAINDEFVHYNLFDKDTAEIVSIMCNNELTFITGGGVQSTIWACEPNKTYTVSWNRITGKSRFIVYLSTNEPVVDTVSKANSYVELDTTIPDSTRQYKSFTTGANDNYMLLYFWIDSTGGEDTLNDIQISEGDTLHDYVSYSNYLMPDLSVNPKNLSPDFALNVYQMNESVTKLLDYRPLGQLEKGYICFVADDGDEEVENVSFAVAAAKNVPITFALWTESECVTNPALLSQLRTVIADYGCGICQHGAGYFANYDPKSLYEYLVSEKAAWADLSLTVKGLAYPNHSRNSRVKAICGSLFDVCCSGGSNMPLVYTHDTSGARSNIFDLYRISLYGTSESELKNAADYAKANNKLMIVFYHDADLAEDAAQLAKLNNVIDYAKTLNLDFINVGDIPNIK